MSTLASLVEQAAWPVLALWVALELACMGLGRATFTSGRWCNSLVGASFLLYLAVAFALERSGVGRLALLEPWPALIGSTLFLAGVGLRACALLALGRTFSPNVERRPHQALVTDGVYGVVRHPAYLGSLLAYAAIALLFSNWILLCVASLVFPALYVRRIRVEEHALLAAYGEDYRRYRARVPGLLPGSRPSARRAAHPSATLSMGGSTRRS